MIKGRSQAICRSRWFTPLVCLAFGIVLLAFGLILLLLTSRSGTVRGLTVGRGERFAQLDLRATALAGLVVLVAAIVGWLIAAARGQNGRPYDWLLAAGGPGLVRVLPLAWLIPAAGLRIGGPGAPAGNHSAWIVETSLRR